MKYLLISVRERNITTEKFDILTEAQEEMWKQFKEACHYNEQEVLSENRGELKETSAWITDGNNHDNYDWQIVEI